MLAPRWVCGAEICSASKVGSILPVSEIFYFFTNMFVDGPCNTLALAPIRELILFLQKYKINSSLIALQQPNQPLKPGYRA
ncbi:MAG: hypothetical protein EBV64_00060 [Oxalobacteraceae bacterium]|jgi:hypothetical protein|nr:hypothetical protein [Oxalobacteraceae bacterium]